MFSDAFEAVGPSLNKTEKKPSEAQITLKKLKNALKDRDWRLVINTLEEWPDSANLSEEDKTDLGKSLGNLHDLIEKRKKQGKVFSSESLSDLSFELTDVLKKVEGRQSEES